MKDRAQKLLLAVVSTTLFFAMAEGASRLVRPVALPAPVRGLAAEPDDLLFFRMRPNLVKKGERLTNSTGLRGPEIAEKAPDEFRILSLGESTTFGWKVAYENTYSALLERGLRSVDGRRVRVVNAGAPAYTSFQGLTFLRHRAPAIEPDAVLVYFGANDFTPVTFRTRRSAPWAESAGLTDRELFEQRRRPLVRLSTLLIMHSNLFRLVALSGRPPAARDVSQAPQSRVPATDRRKILDDFRVHCAERGIRLVVVIPWYHLSSAHVPLLREFAAETDVPVIDLPERLHDLPLPIGSYFLDLIHPNEQGHRAIAGAIEDALRELWNEPR